MADEVLVIVTAKKRASPVSLNVNKYSLAASSPYFLQLFFGPYKENATGHFEMVEPKVDALKTLIALLNPYNESNATKVDKNNVTDLLELCVKYDVSSGIRKCVELLLKGESDWAFILNIASRYGYEYTGVGDKFEQIIEKLGSCYDLLAKIAPSPNDKAKQCIELEHPPIGGGEHVNEKCHKLNWADVFQLLCHGGKAVDEFIAPIYWGCPSEMLENILKEALNTIAPDNFVRSITLKVHLKLPLDTNSRIAAWPPNTIANESSHIQLTWEESSDQTWYELRNKHNNNSKFELRLTKVDTYQCKTYYAKLCFRMQRV